MSSALGKFTIGAITAIGLKSAGYFVPALKPLIGAGTTAYSMLKGLDDKMEVEAASSVMEANKQADGTYPLLFVLPAASTSSKADLQKYVDANGGTAWFQVGSNRRLEAYWTDSSKFMPRETKDCALGEVVHGKRDGKLQGVMRKADK